MMHAPITLALLSTILLLSATQTLKAASDFQFVADGELALTQGAVVIDARPLERCLKKSVRGARCLPADNFLGPHGRLPGFANINWLLGTADLSGNEHVLVVGDDPLERDFVAAVFFVAGQKKVSVLTRQMSRSSGFTKAVLGAGVEHGQTRTSVYHGIARGESLIFKNELAGLLDGDTATALIDGRSEKEYWGYTVRGLRGGHIFGARHLPANRLRAGLASGAAAPSAARDTVVYGHNPREGLALLTLMRAGYGIQARVYPGGWAEWSADSRLAVDAVTFPERGQTIGPSQAVSRSRPTWTMVALALVVGMIFATVVFFFFRRRSQN